MEYLACGSVPNQVKSESKFDVISMVLYVCGMTVFYASNRPPHHNHFVWFGNELYSSGRQILARLSLPPSDSGTPFKPDAPTVTERDESRCIDDLPPLDRPYNPLNWVSLPPLALYSRAAQLKCN